MWQIRLLYAVALGESVLPCLPSQEITSATQRHPNRCESTRCCIVMPIMEIKKKKQAHHNGYVRIDRHFRHPMSSRIRSFSSIPVHSLLLSPTFAIRLGIGTRFLSADSTVSFDPRAATQSPVTIVSSENACCMQPGARMHREYPQ